MEGSRVLRFQYVDSRGEDGLRGDGRYVGTIPGSPVAVLRKAFGWGSRNQANSDLHLGNITGLRVMEHWRR